MNTTIIYYIILALLTFNYLFDLFLGYLNTTKWTNVLPVELIGIYNEEKYKKSQDYHKVNYKFSLFTGALSFLATMCLFIFEGFAYLDSYIRNFTDNPFYLCLLFFGILGLIADILSTPFDIYDTFVIEEKFGFNKTTVKTYILDKIKSWLLVAIIGSLLIFIFISFYQWIGELFWIYVWITFIVIMLFITMFYSNLIVPLFNKQTPLPEGELRTEIEKFATKVGFKLDNIFIIDGSKRSTKANAYFTGIGKKKRIVLFDTLVNNHTTEELVAVLAHEIGHYKHKHSLQNIILSVLQTGIMLFFLSLLLENNDIPKVLGVDNKSIHISLIIFGILYSPISFILGILSTILSRKNEYEADNYAAKHFDALHLQNALKKLSVDNLSNLMPHKWYVFFHYSHPTLLQRLANLEKQK